jgi:hypothetical protein
VADQVRGEFTYTREGGLSFTCHAPQEDYELTRLALEALRDEINRQFAREADCPFRPQEAPGEERA